MFCPLISFSVWTGSFIGCDEVCVSNRAASSTTAKGLFWGFPTRFANQLFFISPGELMKDTSGIV